MRHLKRFFPVMLMVFCLALAGCSGSSSSTSSDPLAPNSDGSDTGSGSFDGSGTSSAGKITFTTNKIPTDPDGTLFTLSNEEAYNSPAETVLFPQLIPFKLTDSDGKPRVGVPVKLDVYSQSGSSEIKINFLKNGVVEPTANTVTTDSAGVGIFNITVTAPVPELPGFNFTDGIVYKAVTNDATPITAYGGFIVSSGRESGDFVWIDVNPYLQSFSETAVVGTTLQFTISGGAPPYSITASNPSLVSVTLNPDGHTVIATLKDASLWSDSVTFSVVDSNGQYPYLTPMIFRR